MSRMPLRAAWLLVAATSWTPCGAIAYMIPSDSFGPALFDRAASGGCLSNFSPCTNANLPSSFCCPSGSTCNLLAGNTTVVCCPTGADCTSINPITCDITQQDASLHPEAPIKTTALNGVLVKCGTNACCPFGYSCSSNGGCVENSNQNAAPLQNVPSESATTETTTTAATTTSKTSSSVATTPAKTTAQATTSAAGVTVVQATAGVATSDGSSPTYGPTSKGGTDNGEGAVASDGSSSSSSGPQTASVVGGVIGGLAGLFLIGVAVWFLCGRRLRRRGSGASQPDSDPNSLIEPKKSSRSTSSFGNIINNPLPISSPKPQGDATAFRTDFIRKQPTSGEYSRPVSSAGSVNGLLANASTAAVTGGYSESAGLGISPLSLPSPPPLAIRKARDSTSIPPIRGLRKSKSLSRQLPKHQPREPSTEEINVGVDPSIIRFGGNFTISPPSTLTPIQSSAAMTAALAAAASTKTLNTAMAGSDYMQRDRTNDRMTTFSGLMAAANLDPQRPFVPDSIQSSPASKRR